GRCPGAWATASRRTDRTTYEPPRLVKPPLRSCNALCYSPTKHAEDRKFYGLFQAPSASPQECLGIILGAPGSSPAPEATLERGAPSKGSYTTGLEEVHEIGARSR